ncbi:hypothetical protein [Candidatus Raskinella chloraquaticus]|uniref:Methyltransferase type 11 domain-containing protein n=1 Tax=Candidatus Raskinella chloraquaticus TaxID=1951219 RepID=A0A1W9I3V5_9HYPH|nr:MAG: hypothetical protein A4S15_14395 [Proteobacteria bacterium SG_bin8]
MLTRLALIATAHADPAARRLGLAADSAGLWFRSRRLRRHWADHENHCHQAITRAIAGLTPRRTVLVLGSGQLRDIPLALLAHTFDSVLLVDAVHLWPARRQAGRFANVRCVTSDVTGRLAQFAFGFAPNPPLATVKADDSIDLTISANILSQLPIAAEEWLERHGRPPADIAAMAHQLVGEHLAALTRLPGRVCLLSDIEMQERDRSGTILARHDLLAGHTLPAPDDAWLWPVAPFGMAQKERAYLHHSVAISDFKAA